MVFSIFSHRSRGVPQSWCSASSFTAVAECQNRGALQFGTMADSKLINQSLMTQAMAWRVKYRKKDSEGNCVRLQLRIESLGVHQGNRGGVYPAGVRCKSLCVDALEVGFVKEEVNHLVIAVEETPPEHVRSRGDAFVCGSAFNAKCCSKDELLTTCFRTPYDSVTHMLLGHNHMMLILRAFLTNAHWNLPHNEKKDIKYCDAWGKLSPTAVAASQNGKELGEVLLTDGLSCEILAWRMDLEEPTAASLISQAMNKGHELALRTTELTAVAVLKGEIIVQMSKDAGQRVAFQTVRDRVRAQLDSAADDPDLPELFEFLISAGVGFNSYIDDLMDFGSTFVDSKKRQLRFAAFGVANKMCKHAIWTKIAVMKRAYRKPPVNGYCPSPESAWGTYKWDDLESLEDVLRFFHVTCEPQLRNIPPQSRIKLLANVDVAATDALYLAKDPKKVKQSGDQIRERLLAGVEKYVNEIGLQGDDRKAHDKPWIDFTQTSESSSLKVAQDATKHAPTVIRFDEGSGEQLNEQLSFIKTQTGAELIQLPCKAWLLATESFGAIEATKSTAVAVLHGLRDLSTDALAFLEVVQQGSRVAAVTTKDVAAYTILLPPCVPKQSKVFEHTEHPHAVMLTEKVMRPTEGQAKVGTEKILKETNMFVNPEWKVPKQQTAVAGVTPEWSWNDGGNDTMHPFWVVRRMSAERLAKARCEPVQGNISKMLPRFNCELKIHRISAVNIAVINDKAMNSTRVVEVPCLMNMLDLVKGEELILEVEDPKPVEKKRSRDWKHLIKQGAKRGKEYILDTTAKEKPQTQVKTAVAGGQKRQRSPEQAAAVAEDIVGG